MTLVLAATALAVVGEGALTLKRRFRQRAPWEPTVREIIEFSDAGWVVVASRTMHKAKIWDLTKARGLVRLNHYITNELAAEAGLKPDEWQEWTIDWRHGCSDGTTTFYKAGWKRPADENSVNVFFYRIPVTAAPPKPQPQPAPPAPNLWTERDELERIRSFLASPSAFWLVMDGKVPPLRYYDDGRVVICENGAPTEPEHADLLFDDTKKRKFIVITDNAQDGWKKRGFTSLVTAEKAIADYFDQRRLSLKIFRNAEDIREGIEVEWKCGVKVAQPTTGVTIQQAYVCYLETDEGPRYFETRGEAYRYLQSKGHSNTEIVSMMGYRPREIVPVNEAHIGEWVNQECYVEQRKRENLFVKS